MKQGMGPKKRQKGDALYVVAARAHPLPPGKVDAGDARCSEVIKRLKGCEPAELGTNGCAPSPFRRIASCAVRLEEGVRCPGWQDFDVSVIQHRAAGPAAFLPPTLSVKAFCPIKGLGKAHVPVLRPMLVLVEAGADGDGLAALLSHLSTTRQMAQVVLRSQTVLGTRMMADYTFSLSREETLMLLPGGDEDTLAALRNPEDSVELSDTSVLLGVFVGAQLTSAAP
jgi:hypothetical protein